MLRRGLRRRLWEMMALVVRLRSELLPLLCLVSSRSQEYALEEAVKKKKEQQNQIVPE